MDEYNKIINLIETGSFELAFTLIKSLNINLNPNDIDMVKILGMRQYYVVPRGVILNSYDIPTMSGCILRINLEHSIAIRLVRMYHDDENHLQKQSDLAWNITYPSFDRNEAPSSHVGGKIIYDDYPKFTAWIYSRQWNIHDKELTPSDIAKIILTC